MDETSAKIGELIAETRNVNQRLDRIEDTLTGRFSDLEKRVRKLELWRSFLAGGGAIMGAAVGWLFK